jgi:hypothetical protein
VAVDWDADDWGHGRIHIAPSLPDAHDVSEAAAEEGRG